MAKKPEFLVVGAVAACALFIVVGISMAISDFSIFGSGRTLRIKFPNVEGIHVNSTVKYAGAPVGRVTSIEVLPRKEQVMSDDGNLLIVEVHCDIDSNVTLPSGLEVDLFREGLLGQRFVALNPSDDPNAPELDYTKTLIGNRPIEVTDIAGPASRLIDKLSPMADKLGPIAERLEGITTKVDDSLPNLIAGLDAVMDDSNELMSTFNSKESKERIDRLLANLRVVSANLKVVTSNAKALTSTLAHKPWRVVWGGKVDLPPSEDEVLNSDRVLPTRNEIRVRPSARERGSSPRSRTTANRR